MLGKVLKYELRASGREILPFFGLALVVSGVLRFLFWLAPMLWEPAELAITGLSTLLGVLLVVAAGLAGMVIPIIRFYRGMVSDEGILSFTLPVKTGTHITARTISGSLFSILGLLVAFACGSIIIPGFWSALSSALKFSFGAGGTNTSLSLSVLPWWFNLSLAGLLLALVVVSVVSSLVQVYVSIALGQRIARNKILGSILGYLVVNTVQGIAMLFLMMIPAFALFGSTNAELQAFIISLVDASSLNTTLSSFNGLLWGFTGVMALITGIFTAIEWWLTWYMLDKKLNLT